MIRAARMKRLRAAVLARIDVCGDMEIRLRCRTVAELLDWAGLRPRRLAAIAEREEQFCEVPAFLLESLVDLSDRHS